MRCSGRSTRPGGCRILSSAFATYRAALQRIERETDSAALAVWRGYRERISDMLDWHGRDDRGLLLGIVQTIGEAAREMPATQPAREIRQAVEQHIAEQIGRLPPPVEEPTVTYDGWRAAATGIFVGDIIRLQLEGAPASALRDRLLTGKDGRTSAWRLAQNSLALTVAMLVWASANGAVVRTGKRLAIEDGTIYQKQAIAKIDRRTSTICRDINRQIRDLDAPFDTLVGPQFNPPFHHLCRTATVLVPQNEEA